jgi:hypothetical protein
LNLLFQNLNQELKSFLALFNNLLVIWVSRRPTECIDLSLQNLLLLQQKGSELGEREWQVRMISGDCPTTLLNHGPQKHCPVKGKRLFLHVMESINDQLKIDLSGVRTLGIQLLESDFSFQLLQKELRVIGLVSPEIVETMTRMENPPSRTTT